MAEQPKFHPAVAVSNVSTFIKIMLDLESSNYNSWATLFKNHARAYQVLDHIIPPKKQPTPSSETPPATDPEQWARLDAIVLQWIYGTISNDLLETILVADDTAMAAWNRLAELFQDNKNSRAVHLESQFSQTELTAFPNVSAYCTRLKTLADQLANVGAPVSNERLVLRLTAGLTDAYSSFITLIQQQDPLPTFSKARSMLTLEETSMAKRAARESGSAAFFVDSNSTDEIAVNNTVQQGQTSQNRNNNNQRGRNKGNRSRGRNNNNRGGGRNRGGAGRGNQQPSSSWPHQQPYAYSPWAAAWAPPQWHPPCPYPTTLRPQHRPITPRQQGVLGPRPAQAYNATAPSTVGYTPTDIEAAMHTLSLSPPDDRWYMDTGATSHMTANQGFADGEPSNEE